MTLTAPGSAQADSTAGGPIPPSRPRPGLPQLRRHASASIAEHACAECFGPLEVDYDPELMRAVTREQIEAGPQNIWRYAALLPVGPGPGRPGHPRPRHDPAGPRRPAGRGARHRRRCGSRTTRPTRPTRSRTGWSPGRRPRPRASATRRSPAPRPATWPTRSPRTPPGPACRRSCSSRPTSSRARSCRPRSTAQTLVAVDGSYDDVNRLCSELAETDEFEDTAFVNVNVRPYYAEGSKTLGYEVAEQLGWRLPAQVVIPMASGSLLTKVDKAFRELVAAGLVEADRVDDLRRPVGRLRPDRHRVRQRLGRRQAGQADRHRQVAEHRQPGRRPVRARRGPPHRRRDRPGRRRRDRAGHPAAGPHHRRLRRDRRRRDRRGAAEAGRATAGSTRPRRPSSSTPARASRPSTRWSRWSGPTHRVEPSLKSARAAGLIG